MRTHDQYFPKVHFQKCIYRKCIFRKRICQKCIFWKCIFQKCNKKTTYLHTNLLTYLPWQLWLLRLLIRVMRRHDRYFPKVCYPKVHLSKVYFSKVYFSKVHFSKVCFLKPYLIGPKLFCCKAYRICPAFASLLVAELRLRIHMLVSYIECWGCTK